MSHVKPNPDFGILPFVNATLTTPWTLEAEATSIPGLRSMSFQDKIGFGMRIIALAILIAMAAVAATTAMGLVGTWQRQKRAFTAHTLDKDSSDSKTDPSSLSSSPSPSCDKVRTAMELGTFRPLPAYVHPSPPSGLAALALAFLALAMRIMLVIVSFAITSALQTHALASPTLDRVAFMRGVDWRWSLIRAQAFFDYGATTLYFAAMLATARHLEPSLVAREGSALKKRCLSLGWAAVDIIVCLSGVALWLAAWGVILADTKPDYNRPRKLWAIIQMGVREVDLHTALMAWTVVATMYTCSVLITKVVVALRHKHAIRPIPKIILATFSAIAIPTLAYQSAIHLIWGIATRTADWHDRSWEFRSQWMKTISIVATHPGEMLLLGLVVWVVRELHRLRRREKVDV